MLSSVSVGIQWLLCGRGTREETRQEAEDPVRTHLSGELCQGLELKPKCSKGEGDLGAIQEVKLMGLSDQIWGMRQGRSDDCGSLF